MVIVMMIMIIIILIIIIIVLYVYTLYKTYSLWLLLLFYYQASKIQIALLRTVLFYFFSLSAVFQTLIAINIMIFYVEKHPHCHYIPPFYSSYDNLL